MEQEKRGLCPYDEKRYLLADLPDGQPNPNTHAYGHHDLVSEENLVAVHPEPGAELIIRHVEERFERRHSRVIRHLGSSVIIEKNMPDANTVCERQGDLLTETIRQKGAMRIDEVIEQICVRQSLEPPVSPPARLPPPLSTQRAGPSGMNANAAPFRKRIDSSDGEDDAPERPVWPPPKRIRLKVSHLDKSDGAEQEPARRREARRRAQRNPFIDTEASVDGDASADEEDDNENDDLNGFIVADDVEC